MTKIRNERGLALIITLLIVALLTALILEFDFSTRTDLLAATNFRDGTKAVYLAQSGIAAAKAVLRDDARHSPEYDAHNELWATPFPPYPVGDGVVTVSIQDEGGKLNPNHLVDPSGLAVSKKVAQMKRLFDLVGVDSYLVDGIVDWVDKNNDPFSSYGAEEDYYYRLNPSYRCKNARLAVLSELHMVRGITDEIYEKISPYLTVDSPPVTGQKDGPININTAEAVALQTLPSFSADEFPITKDLAQRIMEARPIKAESGLDAVVGEQVATTIRRYYITKSDHFTVTSSGNVGGFVKTVRAVVKREGSKISTLFWKLE